MVPFSEFYVGDIFHKSNAYKNRVNFKEVFVAEGGLIYFFGGGGGGTAP